MLEQTPNQLNQIIDNVPGMAPVEVVGEQAGQPVSVEGFRGDPRRVIGHPANATNEAAQGYADQLRANNQESTGWSLPRLHKTGEVALQNIVEKDSK